MPLAIVSETLIYYETTDNRRQESNAAAAISEFAEQYLLSNMVAGSVIDMAENITYEDGICLLSGSYRCNEMICRPRTEEIMQQYEQNNGTNP